VAPRQVRTRLETDARRELLLRAGVELLADHSPDQISVHDVARRAGISRGLLYHYFEDKDAFVVAVVQQASEELRQALTTDSVGSSEDPVAAAIDAFITFAEAHAAGFRALVTGAVLNPKVAAVIEQTRERDLDAFVTGVAETTGDAQRARNSPVLRAALHAHMHFMEGAVVRWLARREMSREQLRELLVRALDGAVAAAGAVEPLGPSEPT
jgi:AcrR family transcriptional regulator